MRFLRCRTKDVGEINGMDLIDTDKIKLTFKPGIRRNAHGFSERHCEESRKELLIASRMLSLKP